MRSKQMNVSDRDFVVALLDIHASIFKVKDTIANLAEQGRWILLGGVANALATDLMMLVLVVEL